MQLLNMKAVVLSETAGIENALPRVSLLGFLFAAVVLFSGCDQSYDADSDKDPSVVSSGGALILKEAYAYPSVPGSSVGVVYAAIENKGASAQVLNYVHSPIADRLEVHNHVHEDGMMKMRQVRHMSFQPKRVQRFEPGGYHIMIMDIFDPLLEGDTFPITFEFEGGEKMVVPVQVRPQG